MSSTGIDPLTLLSRAIEQAHLVIEQVGQPDLDSPTPCRTWNVRTLTNHMVHDLANFTTSANGGKPDYQAAIPEVQGDLAAAFRRGADELLNVWRDSGDLTRTVRLSFGEVPASFLVNQQTTEFAVHAWDIATATGQTVDWDQDVAASSLAWARTALKPEFRGDETSGHAFGAEVQPSPDASEQEQLVAFFGRNPNGTASG